MERIYQIAGLRLLIDAPEEWLCPEEGLLAPFAVTGGHDRVMRFIVTDRLDGPSGTLVFRDAGKIVFKDGDRQLRYEGAVSKELENAYMRIERLPEESRVQVLRSAIPAGITPRLIQSAMEAEHLVVRTGGFLLHSSVIEHQGKGILFTALSGTGKSTQARLWQELRGARTINGDRAAVFGDRVRGIPFCGSSGIAVAADLPIGAIVCLGQAPKTHIAPLKGAQAFRQLWEGCSVNIWDDEDMERCIAAVTRTVSTVPVFRLDCTPDVTAVEALEREVLPWN